MKKWVLLLALVALVLVVRGANATPPEPEGWISGETSVSGLSTEEKVGLLGVAEGGEPPKADRFYAEYSYPARVDWRDKNSWVYGETLDFTTPIKDQGECGSCVAFAVIASIESRLEVRLGRPELNPDLSEAHAFYCGGSWGCAGGWWNSLALDYIVEHGVSDEACFPYRIEDPPCELCPDWQERTVNLTHWVGVEGHDEMKQAIADGPISVVMDVFVDFFSYQSGVYCTRWPFLPIGAHAVEIVGYDDEAEYWIAKNSWGVGWGEEGWFRIGYNCGVRPYGYVPFVDAEPPVLDNKTYLPVIMKETE